MSTILTVARESVGTTQHQVTAWVHYVHMWNLLRPLILNRDTFLLILTPHFSLWLFFSCNNCHIYNQTTKLFSLFILCSSLTWCPWHFSHSDFHTSNNELAICIPVLCPLPFILPHMSPTLFSLVFSVFTGHHFYFALILLPRCLPFHPAGEVCACFNHTSLSTCLAQACRMPKTHTHPQWGALKWKRPGALYLLYIIHPPQHKQCGDKYGQ